MERREQACSGGMAKACTHTAAFCSAGLGTLWQECNKQHRDPQMSSNVGEYKGISRHAGRHASLTRRVAHLQPVLCRPVDGVVVDGECAALCVKRA